MLDLRNLRNFLVLARHLNFLRAAEDLRITQPTLTRSIQSLERQLGVRLFDRNRGGVSLTAHGRAIVERASFLLTDAGELERHARLSGQGERGGIRFGMAPMPARVLLPGALGERLRQAPHVTNEVVVRDVEALWGMLVAGEIEFFVSPDRPLRDLSQAQVELLGRFPLSLIVRAGHPLTRGDPGDGRFPLVRSSWTGISVPTEIRDRILDLPNIVEDFGVLTELATTTDAVWLSSAYAVMVEIQAGRLVEIFRASQPVEVNLYAHRRRPRSALTHSMVAAFKERIERLQQDGSLGSRAD